MNQENSDNDESLSQAESHNLTLLLRNAYFAVRRRCNAYCTELDCNGDQFIILSVLSEREGVTQQDLVQRSGYDPATTGKMLRLLEKRGFVERKPHPTDGRAKIVTLTDSGRRTWEKLWESTTTIRDILWKSLGENEREVITRNLINIAQAMESMQDNSSESKDKTSPSNMAP